MTTVETTWPLSIWQRQCMGLERAHPGSFTDPLYTISAIVELRGPMDLAVLQRAVNELIRRHEILRTRFVEDAQVVAPRAEAEIVVLDEVDVHFPVYADSPTPLAVTVSRRDPDEHLLSFHLQHLACDPVTLWSALAELGALYHAELGGPAVPPPSAQFGEYVTFEREQQRADEVAARAWWESALGGKAFARVAADDDAPPFEYRDDLLSAEEFTTLAKFGRAHRGTVLTTLATALACAMGPHVSGGDLLFSTIFRKRDRPQWQRMLGPCFAVTLFPVPAPPGRLTSDYSRAVRDVLLRCQRYNRFDLLELHALIPDFVPALNHFIEFLPADRPTGIAFGPVTGHVVTAAGPPTDTPFGLDLRTRDTPTGVVVGHISGCGGGWRESTVRQLWRDVAAQLRDA
ncbi:condensation domain-containing protein [Kutzneria kofuensis]|uniref:Condensation domain-containing protein n=1 Tax=Kutzneria kofuensis TaxID=103725 RepID=A0A7W9KES5_9PSEU|nr:condensation domain-containing protein [Kutzneria kofuensis]MBB5891253.1 hypothetical protein [Kutzneria kofuensis]